MEKILYGFIPPLNLDRYEDYMMKRKERKFVFAYLRMMNEKNVVEVRIRKAIKNKRNLSFLYFIYILLMNIFISKKK